MRKQPSPVVSTTGYSGQPMAAPMAALKKDETDEGHAIVGITFRVCYGLRVK